MRLDELGELGLLAELERRGLAHGIEHDAAEIGGLVVTQDALVEGVHFRFDLVSWRELGFRAAAVNISDLAASGAEPLALVVTLGAARRYARRGRGGALRGLDGGGRAGARRRHDARGLGRAQRHGARPVGARARDARRARRATSSSSPARSARRARRSARAGSPGRRSASRRAAGSRAVATAMLDVSDGLARRRGAHRAPFGLPRRRSSSSGCRSRRARRVEDLGFGEDYELLAATPDALGFTVIGRCEEGSGVELRCGGEPRRARRLGALPLASASKCARGRAPTTVPRGVPSVEERSPSGSTSTS